MVERSRPDPMGCYADAFPPARYYWHFDSYHEEEGGEGDGGEGAPEEVPSLMGNSTVTEGPLRHFRHPVGRKQVSERKSRWEEDKLGFDSS